MFSKFAFVLFVVGLTPCLKYFSPSGVAATTCETGGFLISNMIGIYKITSPSGKVYIGQSVNIERRISHYKRLKSCNAQPKLYASFLKYGASNHVFEVVALCLEKDLNKQEREYQEKFDCTGNMGLNCYLVPSDGRVGVMSEDAKKKLSILKTGTKHSPESRAKMSLRRAGPLHNLYGKKHSEEAIEKMKAKKRGKIMSPETRARMSAAHKGRTYRSAGWNHSEEAKQQMSLSRKGRKMPPHVSEMTTLRNNKVVIDIYSGVFYESVKEAAIYYGVNRATLGEYLRGAYKNKTPLRYA